MSDHRWEIVAAVAVFLASGWLSPATAAVTGTKRPAWQWELEAGPVWQTVNDQQIPNTPGATRFSLVDLVGKGPLVAWRAYLVRRVSDANSVRLLLAPLAFTKPGVPVDPLVFAGETFPAGRQLEATYKFNSYRVTYRHRFHRGERWLWRVGLTAKIRDARVRLQRGEQVAVKNDLGFVPLLHLSGIGRIGRGLQLVLDLDALAGGPGRAEDLAVKLGWGLGRGLSLRAGYRMVEGGADVSSVYTFAWLHYAVVSVAGEF